ncbi:hypothetical protein SFRURICE_007927 [Spodoptera frugiperda]|nr:hypothetical protein SFRURICE_007927 [Spodoptera frugiperda]
MKYLSLILFMQISFKECTVDINIQELVYIADHLTAVECRRLFASLHFASYNLPVTLSDAEKKVPTDVPCVKLLIKWNSGNETYEGKGKTHALVEHRLRQLGKNELADCLGKLVFHKLAKHINKSLEDESYFEVLKTGINHTIFEDKDSRFAGQRWTTIDSILSVTLCSMLCITVSAFYRMLKLTFRRAKAKHGLKHWAINYNISHEAIKSLPRWSSGCKCDCRARGLWFDSRVGRSIAEPFLVFRKFLSSSTESGNVPDSDQETVYEYDVENGKSNHVSFDTDIEKIPSEDDQEK